MSDVPEAEVYYIEHVTRDVAATCAVLEAAYGWRFEPAHPDLGNARVAALPNGGRCGVRAPMHDAEQPATRNYVRVRDLDTAVERAAENGAQIALPRMEIPGQGVIAIWFVGGLEQAAWEPAA